MRDYPGRSRIRLIAILLGRSEVRLEPVITERKNRIRDDGDCIRRELASRQSFALDG